MSIYLSTPPNLFPFPTLPTHRSVCLSIYLIYPNLPLPLPYPTHPLVCLSIYLSIYLCIYLSIYVSIYLSIYLVNYENSGHHYMSGIYNIRLLWWPFELGAVVKYSSFSIHIMITVLFNT